jgi:hypothetical protein
MLYRELAALHSQADIVLETDKRLSSGLAVSKTEVFETEQVTLLS